MMATAETTTVAMVMGRVNNKAAMPTKASRATMPTIKTAMMIATTISTMTLASSNKAVAMATMMSRKLSAYILCVI